ISQIERMHLVNDHHGDRWAEQRVKKRVGDYCGVVQRSRRETFHQQPDQNARADRNQITDDHESQRVAALETLVGLLDRTRHRHSGLAVGVTIKMLFEAGVEMPDSDDEKQNQRYVQDVAPDRAVKREQSGENGREESRDEQSDGRKNGLAARARLFALALQPFV